MTRRFTWFSVGVKLFVAADKGQRRARQRRVGRATRSERRLFAQQRRRDLPPGHPYA